jgi:hypothetical protein
VPIGIYFVTLRQITPPLTVTVGHVVNESNACLLFRSELDNIRCDCTLQDERKRDRCFSVIGKFCRKEFHQTTASFIAFNLLSLDILE